MHGFASPTPLIFFKHLRRHRIPQLPHHLDKPFTLIDEVLDRPQKHNRDNAAVLSFSIQGKYQDGLSQDAVMQQILPCGRMRDRFGPGF